MLKSNRNPSNYIIYFVLFCQAVMWKSLVLSALIFVLDGTAWATKPRPRESGEVRCTYVVQGRTAIAGVVVHFGKLQTPITSAAATASSQFGEAPMDTTITNEGLKVTFTGSIVLNRVPAKVFPITVTGLIYSATGGMGSLLGDGTCQKAPVE